MQKPTLTLGQFVDECNRRLREAGAPDAAHFFLIGTGAHPTDFGCEGWDKPDLVRIWKLVEAEFALGQWS